MPGPGILRHGFWICWHGGRARSRQSRWPTRWPGSSGPCWGAAKPIVAPRRRKPLTAVPGACKESSEMAIGRSEDRDTPWDPVNAQTSLGLFGTRSAYPHLGQRSLPTALTGRTYDRNRPDPSSCRKSLRDGGRPHMDPGFTLRVPRDDTVSFRVPPVPSVSPVPLANEYRTRTACRGNELILSERR